MKITRRQLRHLINEETRCLLTEGLTNADMPWANTPEAEKANQSLLEVLRFFELQKQGADRTGYEIAHNLMGLCGSLRTFLIRSEGQSGRDYDLERSAGGFSRIGDDLLKLLK
jgi:hypothetical protein